MRIHILERVRRWRTKHLTHTNANRAETVLKSVGRTNGAQYTSARPKASKTAKGSKNDIEENMRELYEKNRELQLR